MVDEELRSCPSCGEPGPLSAKWCEACGHDLSTEPKTACCSCGELAVESDGYCHSCGHRQPGPRDHLVLSEGGVVAVTDRGQRHHHNEDAVAVATTADGGAVAVVCDGVSSTPGSAEVSLAAADAAVGSLIEALALVSPEEGPVDDGILEAAVSAARESALAVSADVMIDEANPPSTTLTAAVARPAGDSVWLSVAWLGDTRLYWVNDGQAHLLTVDHEIEGALTRWLGIDALNHQPQVSHQQFETTDAGPALMVVCSDGLWRYFDPSVGEPAPDLFKRLQDDGLEGPALAEGLVGFANDRGGHDNITVALWSAQPAKTGDTQDEAQGEEPSQ